MWTTVFLSISLLSISSACNLHPSSSLETGIVCRVTKPAALVLNEQTAQVIQAAFKHATFPDITGEKSVRYMGKVAYNLSNIKVSNLTISSSDVDLREDEAINIMIRNVSATFSGTLSYELGAFFMTIENSIDFEIYSSTDLEVNNKLTCRNNRIAADTSDCYLTFNEFLLHLHGDKQPGWLMQLFTNFISFTVKLVIKGQICKEINHVANLLAHFIQERAEDFLSDGDIGVNIDVTSFPVIKGSYMESHHKGLLRYKNVSSSFNSSTFSPSLLTDHKMLYFWFSEHVLNSLALASFLDKRLVLELKGGDLKEILEKESQWKPLQQIFQESSLDNSLTRVWSLTPPEIRVIPKGTLVISSVAVQLKTSLDESVATLYFEADVNATVQASFADKKLILHLVDSIVHIKEWKSSLLIHESTMRPFLHKIVSLCGIPAVIKRLEPALTSIMNSKQLDLFTIINPEIIPHEGYLVVQLDFGFPHHLLVDFLKRSL
ncbi:cholesteryl ester transfer protein isoform X2 [Bombina bombina]|uniref:cholesteryl ester transfer protein isoform X2 n=1 Tax=Bombina bombina TaxID=8345 RepID=UPI00235A9D3F|nr:cholesteryl ester transfer protein isoform X2 [Bombina bombina]